MTEEKKPVPNAQPADQKPPVTETAPAVQPLEKKPPVAEVPPVATPVEKKPPAEKPAAAANAVEKKPPSVAVPPVAKPAEKKPPVEKPAPEARPVEKKPPVTAVPPVAKPVEKKPPAADVVPAVPPVVKKGPVVMDSDAAVVKKNAMLRPQKKRRIWLRASFVLFVIVPTLLGTFYTTFVASDRYVAGVGFSVRTMKASGNADFLGAFTGLAGGGSTTADAYMVLKYIESRDLLDQLRQDVDFQEVYGSESVDWVSRLWSDLEIEKVVNYWRRRINTSFDSTSGIINFEVQAFSAEDAKLVASLVIGYVQELVNTLSEQAREDAVRYAEGEVALAEERMRNALKTVSEFREKGDNLDPAASAMAQIEILASMEKQLLQLHTRMNALSGTVDENAPSLRAMRRQAEALEQQIIEKSGGIRVAGTEGNLSDLLAEYEELQIEKRFSQQAYASAMASLEASRIDAGRQQRYLAVYRKPALPEFPLYPRKVLYPCMLTLTFVGLWGIGVLMVYAVRDHLS